MSDELERALETLVGARDRWLRTSRVERTTLLDGALERTAAIAERWGREAAQAKGIEPGTPAFGEDLSNGPLMLIRHLRLLRDTYRDLEEHDEVRLPGEPWRRPDGQLVVPVFPTGWRDRLSFVAMSGEVWLDPDVDEVRHLRPDRPTGAGQVCLVLGAGNVSSIGASDVLHKLFVENQVCLLKFNPVNDHLAPTVEDALRPLVDGGYLRIVRGGADVAQAAVHDDRVDTLHLTGSDATHDAIVYGGGEEGRRRKADDAPLVDKPFTSELGNVTPVIVVPGAWSSGDLDYQGHHLASMLVQNAGFNCGTPRVIVTHRRWSQRTALLDRIRASLSAAPVRDAYYPGARSRWERFTAAYERAETFGPRADGHVPWTFIPDVDPATDDDLAFREEAFAGVFAETALDAPTDVAAYLDRAVDFVNERLWGTLTATVLVHPRSLRDPDVAAAVDRALARLRYGSVGVNLWGNVSYGFLSTAWGAHPGSDRQDIQSGRGWVHNTYLLADPHKSIVRSPWRLGRKPPVAYDFATMSSLAQRLIRFEAFGDVSQLPGIAWDGLRA